MGDAAGTGFDADAWVLNPADFAAKYDAKSRRLMSTATSPAGYASMSRLLPCSPEHRFLQISVPQIQGEGQLETHRWKAYIGCGSTVVLTMATITNQKRRTRGGSSGGRSFTRAVWLHGSTFSAINRRRVVRQAVGTFASYGKLTPCAG